MSALFGPARLLADIGGTNARFAWQDSAGAELRDVMTLSCAAHDSLATAITHYLNLVQRPNAPWCAIGIANPITGDLVQMTNHHWSFSISALKQQMKFERLEVLNDFTALALALPDIAAADLRQVGGQSAVPQAPLGLIGPGTGLGVSGLIAAGESGRWIPLQGEGGHASLSASNEREAAVVGWLQRRYGHASAERALSGPGLSALHAALCELDGHTMRPGAEGHALWEPARITEAALAGSDAVCVEAVDLFCAFLGGVAGNLALTLGARGGIYVGGGIVPRLGDTFERSAFRERFEAKGRFRSYLADIPAFVICSAVSPALRGVARAL